MMRKKCCLIGVTALLILGIAGMFTGRAEASETAVKKTIHNSPYVLFSPDGQAFTTCAGDRNYKWYEDNDSTTIDTGIKSSLRPLQTGEHYYNRYRRGELAVGMWKVVHRRGHCIHNLPWDREWHGVPTGGEACMRYYYSGWKAFCADCGEALEQANIYMSREAAASIEYLDLGSDERPMGYYYRCPFCRHMEQGITFLAHRCKGISQNQYKVIYDPNADEYAGYMSESSHMYNNAAEYEGETVIPVTHLTENNYTRTGYRFTGWNTRPDGSGDHYADRAEICNLSAADWRKANRETWTAGDNGRVTLYAQWSKTESTLVIDANGGTYDGIAISSITSPYGEKYVLRGELVQPPEGHRVFFETNGGSGVDLLVGTMHLVEWMKEIPFHGQFDENIYLFSDPNGTTDTLKAFYQADPVILPKADRKGWSFGGWYYDPEFSVPAGGAGDQIIPSQDITLYAQWTDLRLQALDNYNANGGKGAVDLSWTQSDQKDKTYILYQKRERGAWLRVNTAEDIGSTTVIDTAYVCEEAEKQYTVPYTGLYTIKAMGAQGKSYGSYPGGYGGSVSGTFRLQKGECLTYRIGGQNGYSGGGNASDYGNGGGMTSVISDRKGLLLIAGGGGGASPVGAGGAGGSMESVIRSRQTGEDGMAGGGAGYFGGTAGEKIVHHHTNTCYRDTSYTPGLGNWEYYIRGKNCYADEIRFSSQYYGHTTNDDGDPCIMVRAGWARNGYSPYDQRWNVSGYQGIPTNGNTTLNLSYFCEGWGGVGENICDLDYFPESREPSSFVVLDQNGTRIAAGNFSEYPYTGYYKWNNIDRVGSSEFHQTLNIALPEGTTHVFVHLQFHLQGSVWVTAGINGLSFSGGRTLICGYEEGQVLSSRPAYGGSNYVNTEYAKMYESRNGVRSGDGILMLQAKNIGYQDSLELDGVTATDHAAPDKISEEVTREALDDMTVRITWTEPKDNGTTYYHRLESYLTGSTVVLCDSNITKNTLVSGVKGYYYLVDQEKATVVTDRANYIKAPSADIKTMAAVQYLHIAAVDTAGNVGVTTHIPIDETEVPWKIYTRQLVIDENADNVYLTAEKSWYVRADGKTPFTLTNEACMEGVPSSRYQLSETIYETILSDGSVARSRIRTPLSEVADGPLRTDASKLTYATEGTVVLQQYPYSYTVRSEQNRKLVGVQKFVIGGELSGQRIQVIPAAGVNPGTDKAVYSDHAQDEHNKITLIADGEAPVIRGMEILENRDLIDRREGDITIRATAEDLGSGLRKFYLVIDNKDNDISRTYTPEADSCITITITKDDPIFSGDFTVLGYAVDNVGNECSNTYGTTEFALESNIERVLEPKEPVFKCGESGVLTFTTWGYADRVEVIFPEAMTALDPTLNRIYDYTETPGYRITEQLPFMVPLYTPENQKMEITVRAYKGDRKLEDHPTISVIGVSGTVLDELRTRLR